MGLVCPHVVNVANIFHLSQEGVQTFAPIDILGWTIIEKEADLFSVQPVTRQRWKNKSVPFFVSSELVNVHQVSYRWTPVALSEIGKLSVSAP